MHEEFTDSDRNSIRFVGSKIYSVQTCNIYYTSYDLQRQFDTVNPCTHPDIMLHSPINKEGAEPYWYARVLGVYHANMSKWGSECYGVDRRCGVAEVKGVTELLGSAELPVGGVAELSGGPE